MVHGCHHRCISTQDGQDLLRVLAMEATTQEMSATDTSAISKAEKLQSRKTRQSECQTGSFGFPGGNDSTWSPAGAEGTQ
jgi:hypothetical protein